jgi:hypothetical protein
VNSRGTPRAEVIEVPPRRCESVFEIILLG